MKIKNESKGIHQRIVTNSSSKAHLTSSTSSSPYSSVKGDDFEIKRRIIAGDDDYGERNDDHNNRSTYSSNSPTYENNYSKQQSTCSFQGKKSCSTSDTLIGFIPLILLVAILSCFVFGVFTIIKLAINHAYKEDYD